MTQANAVEQVGLHHLRRRHLGDQRRPGGRREQLSGSAASARADCLRMPQDLLAQRPRLAQHRRYARSTDASSPAAISSRTTANPASRGTNGWLTSTAWTRSSRTWRRCFTNRPLWYSSVLRPLASVTIAKPVTRHDSHAAIALMTATDGEDRGTPWRDTETSTSPWAASQIHCSRSSSSRKTPSPSAPAPAISRQELHDRGQRMQPSQLRPPLDVGESVIARPPTPRPWLRAGPAGHGRRRSADAGDLRIRARRRGDQRDGRDARAAASGSGAHLDDLHPAVRDDGEPAVEPTAANQQILLALGVPPRRRRAGATEPTEHEAQQEAALPRGRTATRARCQSLERQPRAQDGRRR